MQEVQLLIIGQGLAGTALAWEAIRRGISAHVIDRGESITCSRVAAGLMMPVTGKRLAKSWGWDEFWPSAVEFYREIERRTGVPLLRIAPALRLLQTEQERQQLKLRLTQQEYAGWIEEVPTAQIPSALNAPRGGFLLPEAGRLDTVAYLDASRSEFITRRMFTVGEVDVPADLEITATEVRLPKWDVTADRVVLCRGFDGYADPFFRGVCWNPAHGEIATVHIPDLDLSTIVQFGHWLVPIGGDGYLLGATFSWDRTSVGPTPAGREELEQALSSVVRLPYTVRGIQGAVRPTLCDYRPVIGERRDFPRISILNGLGTKGSLMAPRLAQRLCDSWEAGSVIPQELDVCRWFR